VGEFLTLPRLKALNKYWEANPPLQQQVADLLSGLAGVLIPGVAAPQTSEEYGSFEEFAADFQAAGGRIA
jgi:hypothetical protein